MTTSLPKLVQVYMGNKLLLIGFALWASICFVATSATNGIARISLKKHIWDLESIRASKISRKVGSIQNTRSSNLWVSPSNSSISMGCSVLSTSHAGMAYNLSFGFGTISGFLGKDNVQVGDLNIKDQVFIVAKREGSFSHLLANVDGILGLGFGESSAGDAVPIWHNMVQQDLVNLKLFSFWFNQNGNEEGEITFGGIDQKHFKGEHTFVPVNLKGHWQIEVEDFLIANQSTGLCTEGCSAIVDSGTSFIAGPPAIVNSINHAIGAKGLMNTECRKVVSQYGDLMWDLLISGLQPNKLCTQIGLCYHNGSQHVSNVIETVVEEKGKGYAVGSDLRCTACEMTVVWMRIQLLQNNTKEKVFDYVNKLCDNLLNPHGETSIDCDNAANMPHVSFIIGNKLFNLTPDQYILKIPQGSTTFCISGFVPLEVPPSLWILGEIFMGAYHTVFDYGNLRIGFAEAA
ncbi:hypothetical protein L6164_013786 [Bauhinia variegata]|uniref:Uncharacterized protein n=1 Tax=Bauhinia variegata TaxID=167791 RepID=A0ACB9NG16_BAUVA|nr:hypothetical protein L6164_013786 [Bauhinia variegata]